MYKSQQNPVEKGGKELIFPKKLYRKKQIQMNLQAEESHHLHCQSLSGVLNLLVKHPGKTAFDQAIV